MKKTILVLASIVFFLLTSERVVGDELDCPANSIFSQSIVGSTGAYAADDAGLERHYENFDGLTEDIGGITFWGNKFSFVCPVDIVPLDFDISFYQNNAGEIGGFVQTISVTVTPTITGSDIYGYPIIRCDVIFPSSVSLSEGWVSVVRKNPSEDCRFGWLNTTNGDGILGYNLNGGFYTDNLSFCLIGSTPSVPVSNWAIVISMLLIAIFLFVGYRRRLLA